MQALRLARYNCRAVRPTAFRCLATAASAPPHPVASSSTSTPKPASIIPLSNVEAQWEKMSKDEQSLVHEQLEKLQEKDWKTLSLDEKKAAYYVAFGPHGPRAPLHPPGSMLKIFLGTLTLVGVAGIVFETIRSFSPPPPRTINKEWEEASNQRAIEQKLNPISGITSEGYSGKGFVTHK